jgi:hypothetical protein
MNNRPAHEFRFSVPTRMQIREKLTDLVNGVVSFEYVSDWATEYVVYDNPEIYPEITDQVVWDSIYPFWKKMKRMNTIEINHTRQLNNRTTKT